MKSKLNTNQVYKMYIEDKLSVKNIAKNLECGYGTVFNFIKAQGWTRDHIKKAINSDVKKLKEQIKKLYLQDNLSSSQIATKLNKSAQTIGYHLRNLGIEIRPRKKIDFITFEKLWSEGKTDKEIAEYFKVSELTIKSFRTKGELAGKYNIIRYFAQEDHSLTNDQEQMILGSLLGDLSISMTHKGHNCRLAIVHSEKQKELFNKKVEILGEFMGSYKLYIAKPDKRTGNCYSTYRGNSKAHKVFNDLYTLLYHNGHKTITVEYLKRINSPIALAFWFMDDGTYNGAIATNCFTVNEVELIQQWLLEKWQISTTYSLHKNQPILRIRSCSRQKFDSLIRPFMVSSMYYKLKYK